MEQVQPTIIITEVNAVTNQTGANVGCLLVGEYVDEAEIPEQLTHHPGEVVRPRVVAGYTDVWSADNALKEFTVLLKDSSIVHIRGHGLKLLDTPSSKDAVSYGVKMDVGETEVIVALFPVNAVHGIFTGEIKT